MLGAGGPGRGAGCFGVHRSLGRILGGTGCFKGAGEHDGGAGRGWESLEPWGCTGQ